jgi:hypothetical protein
VNQFRHGEVRHNPYWGEGNCPVLRNAMGVHGINGIDDMSWILGGGSYDGVRDSGFLGCIGETRVVDHALTADKWFTARAVIADETPVTPIPTADPTTPADPATPATPAGTAGTTPADVSRFAATATTSASADSLVRTGATVAPVLLTAVAALGAGAVLLLIHRRRARS